MNTPFHTHTNGKLLLTGEYLVLDGAIALAVPCRYGQHFEAIPNDTSLINWQSIDDQNKAWFQAQFDCSNFQILSTTNEEVATRLQQILIATAHNFTQGVSVTTTLDFPRDWGLGSSSTLLAAIGQWLNIDPYQLLFDTFGGSGYDIACATNDQAIFYQLQAQPVITPTTFQPTFSEQISFVHLGQKQNSRDGIDHYRQRAQKNITQQAISAINDISAQLIETSNLDTFNKLVAEHENIIAHVTQLPKVKELHFSDFPGAIKSLGAWGGDFIMASSHLQHEQLTQYFNNKGKTTILPFKKMVLY